MIYALVAFVVTFARLYSYEDCGRKNANENSILSIFGVQLLLSLEMSHFTVNWDSSLTWTSHLIQRQKTICPNIILFVQTCPNTIFPRATQH
jgi:hypothetical protein